MESKICPHAFQVCVRHSQPHQCYKNSVLRWYIGCISPTVLLIKLGRSMHS